MFGLKPKPIPIPKMDIVTYELTRAGFESVEIQERELEVMNFKKDDGTILSIDCSKCTFWVHDRYDRPREVGVRTLRAIIRLYKEWGWLEDENY